MAPSDRFSYDEFPEWADRGYQMVGFGWHQDPSDLGTAPALDLATQWWTC